MDKKKKETLEELMRADALEADEETEKPGKTNKTENQKKSRILLVTIILAFIVVAGLFISYRYIKIEKPNISKKAKATQTLPKKPTKTQTINVVADGGLNLRLSATQTSAELTVIPNGTSLNVLAESGDWFEVNYNGQTGWILKDYTNSKD